jgi:hypothetical protein
MNCAPPIVGRRSRALRDGMLVLLLGIVSAEQCDSGDSGDYPRVVIGCWQLLERERDQSQAVATLQAYVKVGFTAFDTADIYGPSEEILGKLRREIAGSSSGTPPRFFTKYVTGDSSLEEARRVNAKSRASLGAAPDMVQFHCMPHRARTPDSGRAGRVPAGLLLTRVSLGLDRVGLLRRPLRRGRAAPRHAAEGRQLKNYCNVIGPCLVRDG